jgi:hypothetical protein
MHYKSTIKGVPRSRHRIDMEYWTLVQRLMDAGWYRLGPTRDPSAKLWGFRAGHITATHAPTGCGAKVLPPPDARWIVADSEVEAMHRLLQELKR